MRARDRIVGRELRDLAVVSGLMPEVPARARPLRRFAQLFLALYLVAQLLPETLQMIPVLGELFGAGWTALWAAGMPILGNAALGIEAPIPVVMTGSGDMTWHYVQSLWLAIVAAIAAGVWVGRGRAEWAPVDAWLRVVIRYGLALAMFSYGVAKLVGNQFQPLDPDSLTTTFGDASPMGLLWRFMGHSPAYTWFTGLAEILAGALLFSRRTSTLGALVAAGVMANVVMLNFCYDVPVKLYSSQLLTAALFLAAADLRRIVDVFVLNRPAAAADLSLPSLGRRMRVVRGVAKVGALVVVGGSAALQAVAVEEMLALKNPSPLRGVYEVEAFSAEGEPLGLRDPHRWRRFAVGEYPYAIVQTRDETHYLGFAHDVEAGTITLTARGPTPTTHTLQVEQGDAGVLVLRGTFAAAKVEVRVSKINSLIAANSGEYGGIRRVG